MGKALSGLGGAGAIFLPGDGLLTCHPILPERLLSDASISALCAFAGVLYSQGLMLPQDAFFGLQSCAVLVRDADREFCVVDSVYYFFIGFLSTQCPWLPWLIRPSSSLFHQNGCYCCKVHSERLGQLVVNSVMSCRVIMEMDVACTLRVLTRECDMRKTNVLSDQPGVAIKT